MVESGNLAHTMGNPPSTDQLEDISAALKLIGYDAIGVGSVDCRFGDTYFNVLKSKGLTVVDAIERCGAPSYVIKQIGGVKVGIVSFGYIDPEKGDDLASTKKRYKAYSEARKKSDVLILLDQGNISTDSWLERNSSVGAPDIIVGAATRQPTIDPRYVKKTIIVPTATQGIFISRIDIDITGEDKKLTFTRVPINPDIKEDPAVLKLAEAYEAKHQVEATETSTSSLPPAGYYPYQSCRSCHKAEYDQWKETPHAKALQTLVKNRKVTTDCLPCHSEMYRKTQKVTILDDQIGGVECASCHINVVPHGSDNIKVDDPAAIKAQCVQCHTSERSPKFDMETWYTRAKHHR